MFRKKNYNHNTILTRVFFTYSSQVTLQANKNCIITPILRRRQHNLTGQDYRDTQRVSPWQMPPRWTCTWGPTQQRAPAALPAARLRWAKRDAPPQGNPSLPGATNGKAVPHTHLLKGRGPIIIIVTTEMCSRK